MAWAKTNTTNYTNIAAAIRAKNGGTATYTPAQMPAAIAAIQTGGDLSDVTLWIADFSTWDGVTVTEGDKDSDGREITA